ncbi:MAG: hypothetical protein GWP38_02625 [Planctomycetia bacterium]|nr:hypothetical protein [Planctomycetia bacterium]
MRPMLLLILTLTILMTGAPQVLAASSDAPRAMDSKKEEAEAAFKKLDEAMSQAREAYYEPMDKARKEGVLSPEEMSKIELDPDLLPIKVVGPKILKAIEKYVGTEVALAQCSELLYLSSREESQAWMFDRVSDLMITHYLESESLKNFCTMAHYMGDSPANVKLLRSIFADSPHRDVKAASGYALAKVLGSSKDTREEGLELLKKIGSDFGDVVYYRDTVYGDKVKGDLFEMEHLQIGCVAPEIIGKEVFGNLMQLSSFRGKVVLLDFWGDW